MNRNRRDFVRRALCATASSAMFGSLFGKLSLAHAAVPRRLAGTDYRALVCVFMYGGNDSLNMLVPTDAPHYSIYNTSRSGLALPNNGALLNLSGLNAPSDGATYGLQSTMTGLRDLFNIQRKAAVVANVGPLLYPVTKTQYQNGSVPLPEQLFSHSDQQVCWQSPNSDSTDRLGWGGKLADLFFSSNTNQTLSMNISLDGENVYQAGAQVSPYFMNSGGTESIWAIDNNSWNDRRRTAFNALVNAAQSNPLERAYSAGIKRSIAVEQQITAALAAAPALATPFPNTDIASQLKMVARLISARMTLGMSRQIFFVSLGGFDTHDAQLENHPVLMGNLSAAISAFYAATVELGVANSVTTFTASDFGRTLSSNGDGTDHGWGAHHWVVGGAVDGGKFYGSFPNLTSGGPDDADWGQIIPSTSVDQYAATLSKWYGLADTDRSLMFPNLGRFASPNLGFMI